MKEIAEIITNQSLKCPLIALFQKLLVLAETTSDEAFCLIFEQFESMIPHFIPGHLFNDPYNYALSIFLIFLDKLCTSYQFSAEILHKDSSKSMVDSLLGMFTSLASYPDSRVKDVENADYVKGRGSYRVLFNRFKALEIR